MLGVSGVTVVDCTGAALFFLPAGLRRIERPAFPAPSFGRAERNIKPRAKTRGENAELCPTVITREGG
jgi:hypothetical protein